MDMSKKSSAALASAVTETKGAKASSSPKYKIYWPGAFLGFLAGGAYPAYYVTQLILLAHPAQQPWNVLIDQGYLYLILAAAVVPAYIGAKVFELLLGGVFQKHDR
jgi:hypothetical protein